MSTKDLFWKDMTSSFPDIIKAITSLSKKSYISITNLNTDITWWSQRAMDYFNLDENYTIKGKEKGNHSIHPDDLTAFKEGFKERLEGRNLDKAWEYRIKDGENYHRFSAKARLIYDNNNSPLYIIIRYDNYGISDDIDSVTGLYTDSLLNQRITDLTSCTNNQTVLLKVGINQFSHINVMYGVTFSDMILNNVAQIMLNITRNKGTVYRSSGANFIISFKSMTRDDLQHIYDELTDSLSNNIIIKDMKVPLKICAGAIYIEPHMTEINAIRSRLTYAINHSKTAHHGELVIFNDEINGNSDYQFNLISLIHKSATSDFKGFRLFYQPIADTKTGAIKGMEALIRWELEPYGVVSPGIFMEWLEQDPCIFDLGNWIIRTALTDIKSLRKEHPGFFVNVNIAAAQLERKEFRDSVLSILKETSSSPDELCLELTERCRDLDVNFLKEEVAFFRSQGIKIALDDFGTGNSSLSLALELHFDELKVDMSFIKDIKNKPQNQAMVQSIIDYAKRTHTETCIEGIEDANVDDYIRHFGATWHQGYYYSRPIPISEFEKLLTNN